MAKDAVGWLDVERSVGGGAHGDAVANRVEGISGLDVAGKIACQNYFVVSFEADFRVRDKQQCHRNRQTHALPARRVSRVWREFVGGVDSGGGNVIYYAQITEKGEARYADGNEECRLDADS